MLSLLVALAGLASAYDASNPPVRILSVEQGDVRVDGRLDESVWATASPVTELLRHRPTQGGAPPCRTEIRFLQDAKNLYVGARVSDCDYGIRARRRTCLLYTSPSPRDVEESRMPSSA